LELRMAFALETATIDVCCKQKRQKRSCGPMLRELEASRKPFPEFDLVGAERLETLSSQEPLEEYRYMNLALEADDGAIVGIDANFDLVELGELANLERCLR
jgi:hypothetical protein